MAEPKPNQKPRITAEACKRFGMVLCGSLFVQIFCWAMYSYLSLNIWMCGLSVIVTALLYHFLQVEEQTGLSRKNVFFAAILVPFLLSAVITVILMYRHRNLQHLSANLDGVSEFTELISLYATRLLINGAVLLIFAAVHSVYLMKHPPQETEDDDGEDEDEV
ncbi:MAG: hypothetical protein IJ060_01940 [Oscillospiraceae bacterium]|nr:hypothetical protein [Oscillospiraceae bacterium]